MSVSDSEVLQWIFSTMNRSQALFRLILCVITATALATGCSSTPAGAAKLTGAELTILSNYGLAGSAAAMVSNAKETLVQQCMQSHGLIYYPNIITAAEATSPGPSIAGLPQAYIGLAAREADGYGFYSRAVQSAVTPAHSGQSSQEDRYVSSLPASAQSHYTQALNGPDSSEVSVTLPGGTTMTTPSGGCTGGAERRIYGSVSNYALGLTGAALLTDTLLNAVTADPTFDTIISRWSSCMNRASYHYTSPENLWNILASKITSTPTPAMRILEIRVAIADYNCSSAIKLVPTVRALQLKHASQLSSTLLQNLAVITQIESTALGNARSLHLTS